MKTTTPEILCDACKKVIPVMHPTAIFVTLKGPKIGHKKADLCDEQCLAVYGGIMYAQTMPHSPEANELAKKWTHAEHCACSHSEDCECRVCTDPFN